MEYRPPFLLRNGHLNTIYASLFRRQSHPTFLRKQIETEDDDFLHVDCIENGNKKLAIVCHGLEGSSDSSYIKGISRLLHIQDWDVAAMNFRACSGVINRQKIMYHSGATYDLDSVVQQLEGDYESVILIGFSLGGNLVLKYCGERGDQLHPKIRAVIAVSVPVDLDAGSRHIGRPANFIYEQRFLNTLSAKVKAKHAQFPDDIDIRALSKAKTLFQFDDLFTAPIHGFRNAEEYYRKASSRQFIRDIKIPGLIINALDDPFLPEACYPYNEVAGNTYMQMETPQYGGHVGFVTFGNEFYWSERRIVQYLTEVLN